MNSVWRRWLPRRPTVPVRRSAYHLRLEWLEGRAVPAVYAVTTATDITNPGDGVLSLREAVVLANQSAGTADTVTFDPTVFATPQTIVLTAGALSITDSLTVAGAGPAFLTVSGNDASRVFIIDNPTAVAVTLADFRVAAGRTTEGGGALYAGPFAQLRLERMIFDGNTATLNGGAVFAYTGTAMTVEGCTFVNNRTTSTAFNFGQGGAINGSAAPLTIIGCTFANNSARSGGGLVSGPNLRLESSTFTGNSAMNGGGLFIAANFFTRLANLTVSGNTATERGGGIQVNGFDSFTLDNCTVVRNVGGGVEVPDGARPEVSSSVIAENVGTDIFQSYFEIRLTNSALGTPPNATLRSDSSGNLPFGIALQLGPLADNGGPTRTHRPANTSPLVNRGLNPLALATDQRGGPRAVGVAPDIGSVETDATTPLATAATPDFFPPPGVATYTFTVTYTGSTDINVATLDDNDVRVTGPNGFDAPAVFVGVNPPTNGTPRTATYRVTAPGGVWDAPDQGRYFVTVVAGQVAAVDGQFVPEAQVGTFFAFTPATFVVTSAADSGPGTLRQAILNANTRVQTQDTITFDPATFGTPQVVSLMSGLPAIMDPLTIVGPGVGLLTVRRDPAVTSLFRAVHVGNGVTVPVAISGLTVTNPGGGFLVTSGQLTLEGVAVVGCDAAAFPGVRGPAIDVQGGALTLRNSTFADNASSQAGGAVYHSGAGPLLVENCTFANNVAGAGAANAGALFYSGSDGATFRNSTFSGNRGAGGGGLRLQALNGAALVLQNCTVTGNGTAGSPSGGLSWSTSPEAPLVMTGCAVVGNVGTSQLDGPPPRANDNVLGVPANYAFAAGSANNLLTLADPLLGPLADNGGPTRTHLPLPGSPLIDRGSNPTGVLTDQRGAGFPRVRGAAADAGSVETQPPVRVLTAVVNGGGAQRSRVTSLVVTFDAVVGLPANPADAFRLTRAGGDDVALTADLTGSTPFRTVVRLTFAGSLTEFGSLVDGRYELRVRAGAVMPPFGLGFDGNGDGTAGDDYVLTGSPANGLFRLYGDINGDGVVNASDFGQFRNAFGTAVGQAAYVEWLDVDGDGVINAFDFGQFRSRFGATVP